MFVTDVHASEEALSWALRRGGEFDAIIVGGDLARRDSRGFTSRFLQGMASTKKPVMYVPGNADLPGAPIPEGVVDLHGKVASLWKFKVGGLGGSNPTPFHTPFELDDEEAGKILAKLGHVDVLVSHCPPARTKCDRAPAGHVGSEPVRTYVERERPLLVLSGHAHEARAIDKLGAATVVNPGPLREGNFAVVRLDSVISVELRSESLK